MKFGSNAVLACLLLSTAVVPASAQDLLGGIIGGDGDSSLITLSSGSASDSGLVNLGLGSDANNASNVLDVGLGSGSNSIVDANVSAGGTSGLGVDVGLLNDGVTVDANVGGSSGLVDVNVGLGGGSLIDVNVGGGGNGGGGGGGNGGGGNGGGNGGGGNGGNNTGNNNNNNNGVGVRLGGSGGGGGGFGCTGGESSDSVASLIGSTDSDASSWSSASNISVQKVQVCPEVQQLIAAQLANSNLGERLSNAVAADALISASLSRTVYDADRVFAVTRRGSKLTVYVY